MTDQDTPDPGRPENRDPAEKLPPGVPEPPDLAKVRDLRQRMEQDRAKRGGSGLGRDPGRGAPTGKQARDIGTYTIIPMMMIAGPLVGYLLGKGVENMFGGEPWPGVIGMLFGLVAAFRQIFLLLADRAKRDREE
jgi:F0F1-type ATP synthase assembly protein I